MASIMRVNPLPARAHGTAACKTPCSWQLVRGTRALSSVRCCQKSRCRHFFSPCREPDRTPRIAGKRTGCPARNPARASTLVLPHPSRFSTTFHPLPKPSALLKRTLASIAEILPSRSGEHQLSLPWPKATHPNFSPNACRGERCGIWGRTTPIKSVPATH